MVAYDHETTKMKHYRVDKMKEVSIKDTHREGKEIYDDLDMGEYALENFSMFLGGDIRRVHIEFPNEKVGIFIDRFGKDINIRNTCEGRSMIAVDVAISSAFFEWIFGLGADVKITGPEDIVKQIQQEVELFLNNYK